MGSAMRRDAAQRAQRRCGPDNGKGPSLDQGTLRCARAPRGVSSAGHGMARQYAAGHGTEWRCWLQTGNARQGMRTGWAGLFVRAPAQNGAAWTGADWNGRASAGYALKGKARTHTEFTAPRSAAELGRARQGGASRRNQRLGKARRTKEAQGAAGRRGARTGNERRGYGATDAGMEAETAAAGRRNREGFQAVGSGQELHSVGDARPAQDREGAESP